MKALLKRLYKKFNNTELNSAHTTRGFLEVRRDEIEAALFSSWKNPSVPDRQYKTCTVKELDSYKKGQHVGPYGVLVDILKDNISEFENKKLLEVGCSSGYYSEVLKIKGIGVQYYGCDYSEPFIKFARRLYPELDFQVQDACLLTYADNFFDIVVSGCCLLHIMDYKKAIEETARVASDYVIFHRTPVLHKKETSYFIKTAYGVEMFEIHFNERELLRLMKKNSLKVIDIITFNAYFEKTIGDFYAYKTYLCKKG